MEVLLVRLNSGRRKNFVLEVAIGIFVLGLGIMMGIFVGILIARKKIYTKERKNITLDDLKTVKVETKKDILLYLKGYRDGKKSKR